MPSIAENLIASLNRKDATIGIIGLGYVGLPLSLAFVSGGYNVIGLDIDTAKVDSITKNISYINHISSQKLKQARDSGRLQASTDFSLAAKCDAIIICVPTPLSKYRDPDISYIVSSLDLIASHLRKGQIISLESTTYPGTTDEILFPRIRDLGFNVGDDFFLSYSPEREDPGNKNFNTSTIPKVLGGFTGTCAEVGSSLYSSVISEVVVVSSCRAAEMTKLLENIHRAVNIGLVNELKIVADKMNIDIYEVIGAAATKPFGFVPYYPGPGLGGHCIPIDPFYLTWKAREYGLHTRFIELAGEINSSMPEYVVRKLTSALNKFNKSVNNSKILILGLSYKKNIDDLRESPSLKIISDLNTLGASLSFSDPFFKEFPPYRNIKTHDLPSVELSPSEIQSYDALVISTDHDDYDYDMIQKNASLIIDTRGKYSGKSAYENVVFA